MAGWSSAALCLLAAVSIVACDRAPDGTADSAATGAASTSASAGPARSGAAPDAASAGPAPSSAGSDAAAQGAVDDEPLAPALSAEQFRSLVAELSERGADFFSDNYLSNETSYLQPAARYESVVRKGGVYIGVGPEQNFTYIALSRPAMAYIVDIRRGNLVLQLLYKAAFDLARSRSEFLTLLVGRPYDAATALPEDATVEQVIAHAERLEPTKASFQAVRDRIVERIEKGYGIELSPSDRRDLRAAQRALYDKQLDLRFELKENSVRRYPPLRDLLAARDPEGIQRGFLATEAAFRFVQKMQKDNRIVPMVGDFGGRKALAALGEHLERSRQVVATFYVSNVEQYLFENGVWHRWVKNIEALPIDDRSLFIRCYLDQGRSHPRQLQGHRTATVLQRITDFLARERSKPYRSMWAVSTDDWLADAGAPDPATHDGGSPDRAR